MLAGFSCSHSFQEDKNLALGLAIKQKNLHKGDSAE